MAMESDDKGKYSRRNFLYKLGIGVSAAISGYVISKSGTSAILPKDKIGNSRIYRHPKLSEEVARYRKEGDLILTKGDAMYGVNAIGEQVISLLNGKNSILSISKSISMSNNITLNGTLQASVATFISQLATVEFLENPFFVTLYETYE